MNPYITKCHQVLATSIPQYIYILVKMSTVLVLLLAIVISYNKTIETFDFNRLLTQICREHNFNFHGVKIICQMVSD